MFNSVSENIFQSDQSRDTGFVEKTTRSFHMEDPQAERVERLMDKHLRRMVAHERNVIVGPFPADQMERYARGKLGQLTDEEPLLIFDCMGDGFNEGLVVTRKHLAYVMRGQTARKYELQDIKMILKDKKTLSQYLFGKCFSGEYIGGVMLNGVRDVDGFVSALNDFFLELNQPFKYEEREKKRGLEREAREKLITERGIANVLQRVCEPYICQKARCTIGAPLRSSHAKGMAAKETFGLDPSTELFVLYDASLLLNGSVGFVLCEQGLVYKLKNHRGMMDWAELKQCKIGYSMMELSINGLSFRGSPREGRMVAELLTQIQQMIN